MAFFIFPILTSTVMTCHGPPWTPPTKRGGKPLIMKVGPAPGGHKKNVGFFYVGAFPAETLT